LSYAADLNAKQRNTFLLLDGKNRDLFY